MLKILATADIHSPRYLELFRKSLEEIAEEPDTIILAGDLVDKNNVHGFKPVHDKLVEKYGDKPIVAVYGNEEYRGFEYRYRELYSDVKWLNDEYVVLEIKGWRIGIVGTRGALDKPTPWQARNIPGIYRYYRELPSRVASLIDSVRERGADTVILVSHYGVTRRNLEGEPKHIWPYLACSRFEEVIYSKKPDLVIHGHVHNGVKDIVYIGDTPVYNVSLPARGGLVFIKHGVLGRSRGETGLYKWFKKKT